ncbi:TetR-like C-terminal domain-containing protein [Streptomyces sp. NBC_00576]|uniref:TetR-like C-terminal domain-containing protein n=1 Tax=Streptomyces sp. NBC_00576 TaxID=2903665 RepID=UPI002E80D839|nr:TetR-like C-terminal domain-containing protein [Streptomyces sp. NBC_00576]WUB69041.1 WHG domain-containing protein [Streptomyces sp. NBC_00576]
MVDRGFEQYLVSKRDARPTADPVADLKRGWDNHMRFALEHPNHYRLMYSPELTAPPAAEQEAHALLHGVLERCAAAGLLTVPPEAATRIIMAANVGAALSMLTRPEQYPDIRFAARLRDSVIDSLTRPADAGVPRDTGRGSAVPAAAATLAARLRAEPPQRLTAVEVALLQQWLGTLADSGESTA